MSEIINKKRVSLIALNQKGLIGNFVEIIIAIAVLALFVFVFTKNTDIMAKINKTRHQNTAYQLASQEIDQSREIAAENYSDLVSGTNTLTQLPSGQIIKTVEQEGTIPLSELKRLTIRVEWKEQSAAKSVELVTYVTEGGLIR